MNSKRLGPETIGAVADRLKVLAEAGRLSILNELRSGPRNVSELIDATGLNQANLSKHLQLLYAHGFVSRRREGLFMIYALADRSVFELCDIICGQLKRRAGDQLTRFYEDTEKNGEHGEERRTRRHGGHGDTETRRTRRVVGLR